MKIYQHNFIMSKLFVLLISIVVVSLIGCTSLSSSKKSKEAAEKGFVTVDNGSFYLNGSEFRFAGTNNYYMHYSTDKMQSDVLDDAVSMGFRVLRLWGFQNGINTDHNSYGMIEPDRTSQKGVYGIPEENKKTDKQSNEFGYPRDVFERLDYTIAEAGKRGIKLVIAMNNYWADFGGLQQASTWQKWFGLKDPTEFYTNKECIYAYKEYIKFLLTRVNTYTGIPYNEDPTIMTWELMNEPRNPQDTTGKVVTEWATEMSKYVKSLAPYQLCAVGDEGPFIRTDITGFNDEGSHMYNGTEGTDFDALLAIPSVDYGTYHLYPESWGIAADDIMNWGKTYIEQHIESGKTLGKPVVLEEYGIGRNGMQNRNAIYDCWNKAVYDKGGAGSMVWILTSSNEYELTDKPAGDGIYDDYDGFRILNDNSDTSLLLKAWAARFASSETEEQGKLLDNYHAFLLDPAKDQEVKGTYTIRAILMGGDNSGKAKKVNLYINGELAPAPNSMQYNAASGVYRIKLNTETIEDDSSLKIKAVFVLADGTTLETAENTVIVSNKVTYSLIKQFDFSTEIADAVSLGGYQAEIKKIILTKLNGGMLQVDATFPGENEWEELKVKFPSMSEVSQAAKLSFTVYIEKSLAKPHATKSAPASSLPGMQNYIAFDPGWVKTGIGTQNCDFSKLETVKLDDGKEYLKQTCEFEFFNNPQYTLVTICPTFGYLAYTGSVYLDDICLYKKD